MMNNENILLRVHANCNYSVLSNHHIKDKELSWKAKGILSLMLGLPEYWDFSINGLVELSKDGRDSVMSGLEELESHGYFVRNLRQDERGKFIGYVYDIYEIPFTGKPYTENPNTDNPIQYTNNMLNILYNGKHNNMLNNNMLNIENNVNTNNSEKNKKKERDKERKTEKIPPTIEEITKYCNERNNGIDPVMFYNFYESKGWLVGKNKMKSWKACVNTWERKKANGTSQKRVAPTPSWYNEQITNEDVNSSEELVDLEAFFNEVESCNEKR